jgi:hypothetical protein
MTVSTADRQAAILEVLKAGYFITPDVASMLGLIFGVAGNVILEDVKMFGPIPQRRSRY